MHVFRPPKGALNDMNMVSKIAKFPVAPSVGALLAEARLARGYSLDDVAETTGLTVAEVTALEMTRISTRRGSEGPHPL